MKPLPAYTDAIAKAYPELAISSAKPFSQDGQYNDIIIVNESLIFRFPRYDIGLKTLATEVEILQHIQNRTSLAVPNPQFVQFEGALDDCFMGYRLLPGRALTRQDLPTITDDKVWQKLAQQLAGFLLELHGVPAGKLNLPLNETLAEFQRFFEEVKTHLFSFMRPGARESVTEHFETYFNSPNLHQFQPVIRHGDFGAGNILWNPETAQVMGIIDFGFAGLGDPAIDIAAVSTLGKPFFRHFRPLYPNIEPLLQRADFYRGTYALYEALHGFKNGDKPAFDDGIASYI